VKVLIIVNESPWSSTLGVTALRVAEAFGAAGLDIAAVYFREEGVYHAQPGRATDSGTPNLFEAWQSAARQAGFPLLVCASAAQRRLPGPCEGEYREAGLAEVMEFVAACDRVVSF
jgi:tRNA 2-thiouridine synthesizing protein D